jgi:hypothetical protein
MKAQSHIKINTMKFELINGSFSKEDTINLLTKLIDVKIKYHEDQIRFLENEEDIKMKEKRIKQLQKNLYETRKQLEQKKGKIQVLGEINF